MRSDIPVPTAPVHAPIVTPSEIQYEDELSIFYLVAPLVRQWRRITLWVVACAAMSLLLAIVLPRRYTASASFTPEASSDRLGISGSLGGLSGLAGSLGIPLGGLGNTPPPDFYVALLQGRTIARELLEMRFLPSGDRAPDSTSGRTLIDLWGVHGSSDADRWERAIKKMNRRLGATVDRKASIVTVTMTDADPRRAAAIANTALGLLNRYNIEQRQSQSRQQRLFAERRLADAQAELQTAEDRELQFLTTNRSYSQSPVLTSRLAQVHRLVEQKQEVVLTLSKSYEEARIAEARDVPVLSVVERADPPARASFPIWWKFLLVGIFFGIGAGGVAAVVRETSRALIAADRPDYQEFRSALHEARDQLRRAVRRR